MSNSLKALDEVVAFLEEKSAKTSVGKSGKSCLEESKVAERDSPFGVLYSKLLQLTESSSDGSVEALAEELTTQYAHLFEFEKMPFVDQPNNQKVLTTLSQFFLRGGHSNHVQARVLYAIRILSRSKKGIKPLFDEKFIQEVFQCLQSKDRELVTQALSCMVNMCNIDMTTMQKFARNKKYINILNVLTDKTTERHAQFLCLHLLFYLTADKEIATQLYEQLDFFRYLFQLFLDNSRDFEKPSFWEAEPNTTSFESLRIIKELLSVLFNFTLVEDHVIKFKLDKMDNSFTKSVVYRAVSILNLPHDKYEPNLNLAKFEECAYLLDKPGLIAIKLGLCTICIYDGDILAMNLPITAARPIAQIMELKVLNSRNSFDATKTICPLMMFLKSLMSYNSKIRHEFKLYLFKEDAEPAEEESDEETEEDAKGQMPMQGKLDFGDREAVTIKNVLIKHLTSIDYSVKRLVGEFFLALCGDDTNEYIRLCGFGSAVGTLVDKGMPGFGHLANQESTLDKMLKAKKKQKESDDKNKQ